MPVNLTFFMLQEMRKKLTKFSRSVNRHAMFAIKTFKQPIIKRKTSHNATYDDDDNNVALLFEMGNCYAVPQH